MASSGSRIYPADNTEGLDQFSGGATSSKDLEPSVQHKRSPWRVHATDKLEMKSKMDERNKKREDEVRFVRNHFHQKECQLFIPDPKQFDFHRNVKCRFLRCHCGEILSMHAGMRNRRRGAQFANNFLVQPEHKELLSDPDKIFKEPLPEAFVKWSMLETVKKSATNAFGRIDFNVEIIGGKKAAKYVRVSEDDSVDHCIELMTKHWGMMEPEPPSLVISVVGGAKNFQLDSMSRDIFNSGLIKAAKTTKAWLITSGGNMGVMKAVGQAVNKGQSFVWVDNNVSHLLRCIGISPWGYVKSRQVLEKNSGNGQFNAYYRTGNDIHHDQPVPLNPYHTHFIFVDNGYRIHYGGVSEFRAALEKKISSPVSRGGLGIPLVQILLEGGIDAIHDVFATVSKGTPVIVCAGSGRAANVFAYACKHTVTNQSKERVMSAHCQDKLARKIYAAFPANFKRGSELDKKKRLDDLMYEVTYCCQIENMVTVFYLNKHEELDLAILSVLLKDKPRASSTRQSQLQLAMTWNRADIAQTKIFREDVNWEEGSLENAFTQALVEDKHQFVKLLLNNGIIMRDYLTRNRLQHLYNSLSPDNYLHRILKATTKVDYFSVDDISAFLTSLLDKYEDNKMSYQVIARRIQRSPVKSKSLSMNRIKSSLRLGNNDTDTDDDDESSYFKQPYKQLLVWAVLMQRKELARLFWELGEEPIMSALVASRLCGQMEWKVPKYLQTVRDSFHGMKDHYEQLAISVLDECHANDPGKAIQLVERPSPIWSQMKSLQVATAASNHAFVSSVACQNSINNVWKKHILSSWPKVFAGAIFPPLILSFVNMGLDKGRKMGCLEKIISFYTSPLTKFALFTASYAIFLALFSYMLLVDFKETPSASEWICILWIASFLIGGLHAFILFPSPTLGSKLRDYFGSMDRLDTFNLILAFIAFCVRWKYVYEGKVIYCVNIVIFYIRVMKLYTGNRNLGPKIYMINKMVAELITFLMVLLVFLLAYGVASQGLLYKHRNHDWVIFKDILYFPYWQLYGEIFLDEIETDHACTASLSSQYNGSIMDSDNTCRTYHPLVPILLALYLLVGNVLLLSILIAIFSHVFDSVEKNAIEIWKFQMYFLVMEFVDRPTLPPPLSLFAYVAYAFQLVQKKLCNQTGGHEHPSDIHQQFLSLFEKEMMANKLRNIKVGEMNSIDMKLDIIEDRLNELTRVVEEELIIDQEVYNMDGNKAKLETQVSNQSFPEVQEESKPWQKTQNPTIQEEETPVEDNYDTSILFGTNIEAKKENSRNKKDKRRKLAKGDDDLSSLNVNDKSFNIHLPGIDELGETDKIGQETDDRNDPSTCPQDTTMVPPPIDSSLPSQNKPGNNLSNADESGRTAAYNPPPQPQRPGIRRRISKRIDPVSDSDEEVQIPINIYAPKCTVDSTIAKSPSENDNSSEEEMIVNEVRNRLRRHISRRQFEPDL